LIQLVDSSVLANLFPVFFSKNPGSFFGQFILLRLLFSEIDCNGIQFLPEMTLTRRKPQRLHHFKKSYICFGKYYVTNCPWVSCSVFGSCGQVPFL